MATPIRINTEDYEGGIVIEAKSWWNRGEIDWAVPAWEEMGLGGLVGTNPDGSFSSIQEAQAAIAAEEKWLPEYGYVVTP